MTNVQNYRPLNCRFLLPMLLDAIFQQLQAYMGVHSGRELPKNFFPYYRKNDALKFKNKEKRTKTTRNKAKSGYSRVQFPLVLCVAIIYISQIVKLMWSKVLLWTL